MKHKTPTEEKEQLISPLMGFMDFLKLQGFVFSVTEYLNVYNIFGSIITDVESFEDLKYALAPILVKSEEEQDKFYDSFDTYFGKYSIGEIKPVQTHKEQETAIRKKKKIISKKFERSKIKVGLIAVAGALALIACYQFLLKEQLENIGSLSTSRAVEIAKSELKDESIKKLYNDAIAEASASGLRSTIQDSYNSYLQDDFRTAVSILDIGPVPINKLGQQIDSLKDLLWRLEESIVLKAWSIQAKSNEKSHLQIINNSLKQAEEEGLYDLAESLQNLSLEYSNMDASDVYNTLYDLVYQLPDSSEIAVNIHQLLSDLDGSYTKVYEAVDPYDPYYGESYDPYQVSATDIKFYLVILLITGFALYEYYLNQNQSFVAQLEQGKKPPYIWQFNVEEPSKITWDAEIYQAANNLRKRTDSDEKDFDIHQSIKRTIHQGGMPELAYKTRSKPSEYLVLIDQSSQQSHQASFFSFLAKEFSKNDIYLQKFFFRDDMWTFWSDDGKKKNYRLPELIKLFPKYRLIIFGDGHNLINLAKSKLSPEVHEMDAWKHKAILTTRPSAEWDYKEIMLAESFIMLPANTTGLIELIDHFEEIKSTQLGVWKYDFANHGINLPENPDLGIAYLEYEFTPEVFRWLCCCAVYPQLFWDLTMYLGEAMFPTKSAVNQENILSLLRLPWFEKGFIPQEYRERLLGKIDPETRDETRKCIVKQMQKNPPQPGTYAYDEYRLNLLVNELMIKDLPERRKKMIRREINEMEDQTELSYYTEIKAVSPVNRPSWMDFILPEEIRNLFKGAGLRKTLWRAGFAVLLISIFIYSISDYLQRALDNESDFLDAIFAVSCAIYAFAYYLFMRFKCLLNSFEVSFYWFFLSIGFSIIMMFSKTYFFGIIDIRDSYYQSTDSETQALLNAVLIYVALTLVLILNQIKKRLDGPAVAIYWLGLLTAVIVFVLLLGDANGSTNSESLEMSIFFISSIVSLTFLSLRYRFNGISDTYERSIYWLTFFMISISITPEVLDLADHAAIAIGVFYLIVLFIMNSKRTFTDVLCDGSFSIYWIGIIVFAMFVESLYDSSSMPRSTYPIFIVTVFLVVFKFRRDGTIGFESTIYLLIINVFLLIMLSNQKSLIKSSNEVSSIVMAAVNVLCLISLFRMRKGDIHTLELLIYWAGITLLMVFLFEAHSDLEKSGGIIILLSFLLGVFFIIWKIRAGKYAVEQYQYVLKNEQS